MGSKTFSIVFCLLSTPDTREAGMEKQQAAAMYAEESFIAFDDKQESLATNNPLRVLFASRKTSSLNLPLQAFGILIVVFIFLNFHEEMFKASHDAKALLRNQQF